MQLENLFLNIYLRHCDQNDGQTLQLDLRFNVILFGVVRLETVKIGIENLIKSTVQQRRE